MIDTPSSELVVPVSSSTDLEAEQQISDLVRYLEGLLRTLKVSNTDPSIVRGPRIEQWADPLYRYLEIKVPRAPTSQSVDLNFLGDRAFIRIER